jgi:hypothetical protein
MNMPQSGSALNDEKLVLDTIATYLKALQKGDKSLFHEAFAETANVSHCSIADEKIAVSTLPKFLELVDDLHKNNGGHVEEFHTDPIVAVTGPVASVHVPFVLKLGSEEFTGTDVFALARIDGSWKITSKLYSM